MKRVTINQGQIGVVSKNGKVIEVLKYGTYTYFKSVDIRIVAAHTSYLYATPLEIEQSILKNYLEVIEVNDASICLVYSNENLVQALTPGSYAFWKGGHKYTFELIDRTNAQMEQLPLITIEQPILRDFKHSFRVESYEEGLLMIDGKYTKKLTAGNYHFWNNAQTINVLKADLRLQTLDILGQEILTKDKVQLRLNVTIQYNINAIETALIETNDYQKQLYNFAQLAIRTAVGQLTIDELLLEKDSISQEVLLTLKEKAIQVGVQIQDAGLKDIILPGDVREIMNQVLIAEKKAQANSITRREETAATRSLLNTAKLMEENQMLFKLKEMEYIEKIAEKINSISVSSNSNVVAELKQIFTK